MVKNLRVDPHAKVTASTTSMVSVKEKRNQPEPYYETLETYQGLPCPYGGYYGFYYPGLDGSVGEAKDNGYYGYGTEVQYPVMQGENGSLIYLMPGFQSYDASQAYMPISTVGVSSQALHSPMYAAQGYYQNQFGYGDVSSPTYLWDPVGDKYVYGVASNNQPLKQNISSSSHNHNNYYSRSKNSFTGHSMGDRPKTPRKALQNSYAPPPLHNQERGGFAYPMDPVKKKSGALNRDETDKAKARNRENGNSTNDLASGQDHITNGECESCTLDDAEGNERSNGVGSVIRRDQYNLPSFQTKYEEAIFFVIKSYSEDDIHKSIKYNVWSSTLNGNKKLDSAYQESQKKIAEKSVKCPVFLFFSVNASGQFCGVAEMVGRVDYEKSMEFWQQDKWTGYFPVKWHMIKDVPNPQLRHIILENNENKPVTNSRDTQEVRLPQGNEVLNIFKNYAAKTSILDDFDFYENREKVMVQKKLRFPPVLKKKEEELVADFKTMEISNTAKEGNTDLTGTVN
ncbi:PREDICTED: YTH domain-containing family protein 2 isoform X2 [Camelina sativa]|nr:PREDICTED: YTH domain-containing family protein 2 isoform X2 [Camelina sativa]XP_019085164.1 PREDICTED: YTH domain-containing family protein 2 isoform X2 [Camelina sativa]XP_019085165.1 PREDICTED: YTH domain-containing family protein 2 isoform X2 [Camelina sativa]